jgi:hypothetical protein
MANYLVIAPPSPTRTKGAQDEGLAHSGLSRSLIVASIAWRKASAVVSFRFFAIAANIVVMSFTASATPGVTAHLRR